MKIGVVGVDISVFKEIMYFEGGLFFSLKSIGDWNKLWVDLKNGKMDNF